MQETKNKALQRLRRARRTRARIQGTAERPRLSVFRSNRHLWAQLIDDTGGVTLLSASDLELEAGGGKASGRGHGSRPSRRDVARALGARLAAKALTKRIRAVRFDRGRYAYHGIVQALAESVREGGLEF